MTHLGYPESCILYKSVFSTVSQSSLIADIEFKKLPEKQIIISLNWGTLSPQTPLPSYVMKVIGENYGDNQSFIDFINFFDHHLFKAFLVASYPESTSADGVCWQDLKTSFLKLGGMKSICTLHWLLQLIYPELDIQVKRRIFQQENESSCLRLGECILGDAQSLGKLESIPVNAFSITLYADEGRSPCMIPWPIEVLSRYRLQIENILANMNIYIELFLIIREQNSMARLSNDSYLGYDKIRGRELNKRRILIYRGRID